MSKRAPMRPGSRTGRLRPRGTEKHREAREEGAGEETRSPSSPAESDVPSDSPLKEASQAADAVAPRNGAESAEANESMPATRVETGQDAEVEASATEPPASPTEASKLQAREDKAVSARMSAEEAITADPEGQSPSLAALDTSGVSGQFFADELDSLRPITSTPPEADEEGESRTETEGQRARRAMLRRVVSCVVGAAAVLTIVAVVRSRHHGARPVLAAPVHAEVVSSWSIPAAPPAAHTAEKPVPTVVASSPAPSVSSVASTEAATDGGTKGTADDPKIANELKKETQNLLNRGKTKDAIEAARRAIQADPTDAVSYLYLGAALQDLGRSREATKAFSDCVHNAKRGPIHECRQFGGR